MKKEDPPIIVDEIFNLRQDQLWKIITELDHMHKWFFDSIPTFDPVEGFETSFVLSAGDKEFDHIWKIIEVIPGSKIVYDWSYTGYAGRGAVSFELSEEANQTKLVLTNVTVEDWQEDIQEFKRESAEGGWNYFIKESLKKYTDKLS